jgi:hypothetical protein
LSGGSLKKSNAKITFELSYLLAELRNADS